jgi:hypothetical protein
MGFMIAHQPKPMAQAVPIASIKMTREQLTLLLDELDKREIVPVNQQRREERIPCRCTGMILTVEQQGHESVFAIPVRNVSRQGVAFLHRSMLHPGSRCRVEIRTQDRQWVCTAGKVVRSRHIRGMIYEIGLKFDQRIDVKPFQSRHLSPDSPSH